MSADSGIGVDGNLRSYIGEFKEGGVRSFKVNIKDETMVLDGNNQVNGTFEEDFDKSVESYLDDARPCYVMVRLDRKNNEGAYEWLFVLYCPDKALVREKMTYASTRSSFRRNFGSNLITEEYFTNKKSDVCLKGYEEHVKMKEAPTPLTEMEIFAQEAKESENKFLSHNSGSSTLPGIAMSISDGVQSAFQQFVDGSINYVQLGVDMGTEKIVAFKSENLTLSQLDSATPADEPRYHVFRFPHKYNEKECVSVVFIYSAPGFKSSIKQRMIYSTCKGHCIQIYEDKYEKFDKKIEIENMSELDEEKLMYEIHPVTVEAKKLFSKPRRPGRN